MQYLYGGEALLSRVIMYRTIRSGCFYHTLHLL